jgi:CRISPR system Cascade subunit CasD
MRSVLLRLEGPLQSWGTQGRFSIRDTDAEPSKSGVLGLVAAALGVVRGDDAALAELAGLRMAVRVDAEGHPLRDYHTVGAGRFRGRPQRVYGAGHDTVLTERHYLADASFLVALGGDADLVERIVHALQHPVWPPFLGRRACPPAAPIFGGVVDGDPEQAVRNAPWCGRGERPARLRLVFESADGRPRNDVPLSFASDSRRHAHRYVRIEWMPVPPAPEASA